MVKNSRTQELKNSRTQELKNSRTQEEPTVPRRGPHRSILAFLSTRVLESLSSFISMPLFRMILDIILDIINRRVIFRVKQVNLTELQAFWCNSFGAQPVLPRIQPENFQHEDPVRWAWNLPPSFNVSQAKVP
jgi:hypothetical protein